MADEKSNGFEFAITLLVAFGSIGYAIIFYFQNYPVDIKYYGFSVALLSSMLGLVLFLLLYVFIKGASMEMQDPKYTVLKGKTDRFAASIYSVAFLMFLMLFPTIVITIILLIVGVKADSSYSLVMYFLGYIFSLYFGWPNIVYMDNIYYKNSSMIPVTIQLTGPNTGISINLSKLDSEHNLVQTDLINQLKPNHTYKVTVSGNLSANSLENGKYIVFIDTTNLSSGYYELNINRIIYEKTAIKGFYLSNAS